MVLQYIDVIMQMCSIALVIAAAGLWAGAGVATRPKHRDEQTLVGGAIWSQIIIPIGLLISKVVKETIDQFVQGYYLVTGILLLWITGVVLIVHESRRYKRRQRREELQQAMRRAISFATGQIPNSSSEQSKPQTTRSLRFFTRSSTHLKDSSEVDKIKYPYDKGYYAIGVLCVLAGGIKVAEFVMFVILDMKIIL